MISRNALSFSEKRVSKNAVVTLVLGILGVGGFIILTLLSVFSRGGLGLAGGLIGCLLMLLAFFGVIWGVLSFDDVKTNQKYKISGICLNVIVIFIGITLIML